MRHDYKLRIQKSLDIYLDRPADRRTLLKRSLLVVCWLNNARNFLPGLAAHGKVSHRRKLEKFQLKPRDRANLRKLLQAGKTPWRIARRAQILLQPADKKQRLGSLNEESAQSASTIGGFANVIATAISKLSYTMLLDRVGRPFFQKSTKED